jgi:metallo-beta-lactamase class B
MKIFSILLILFHSFNSSYSQAKNKALNISHLTGDYYIYTTYGSYRDNPVPSNSMYLVTPAGAVLFDTPWDSTQFQPLLDSIRSRHQMDVVMCIATHFHADRTAGLEYYGRKGIKTYTTKQTDELSRIHNEKRAAFLIYHDTSFTIGRHTFQTYFGGAGHTPDNIVVWIENEKILYGGCLVKSVEAEDLGNLSDANVKEWTSTIENIQRKFKTPKYIIPGHLDWNSTGSLTHTLNLIQQYGGKN